MPTITVDIDDTLEERLTTAKEELVAAAIEYIQDNLRTVTAEYDDFNEKNWIKFHEIADGNVPVYTSEIEGLWFLHRDKLEEAYENGSGGENPYENDGVTAIFHYIYLHVEMFANNAISTLLQDFVAFRDTHKPNDAELSAWLSAQEAVLLASI